MGSRELFFFKMEMIIANLHDKGKDVPQREQLLDGLVNKWMDGLAPAGTR